MHAKIAFASKSYFGEREDLVEGTVEDLLLSAAMDYADIHGQVERRVLFVDKSRRLSGRSPLI
jgi:hypothetical protein